MTIQRITTTGVRAFTETNNNEYLNFAKVSNRLALKVSITLIGKLQ